jgi:hypothetical protein
MTKPKYILLFSFLLVLCFTPILNAANTPGLNVSYESKKDLLTVDANGVPLTQILARIAEQSGIEIMIDPSVEKEISIYLPAQPLEKALKQLARGLNYAMHYDKATSRLVAMKIVPQGKLTSGKLISLTKPTARMGRPDGIEDDNSDVSGGVRGYSSSAGDYPVSENKSETPTVNTQQTPCAEEFKSKGLDFKPVKRQPSLPVEQNNNEIKEVNSNITNNNGEDVSEKAQYR